MKLKTIVQGFGAAMLLMLSYLVPMVSPYHTLLYHSILPIKSVIWGILIDFVIVALIAAFLFEFLQRRASGLLTLIWAFLAARLVHTILGSPMVSLGWHLPHYTRPIAFVITLGGSIALWFFRPQAYSRGVRGLLALLFLAGCTSMWILLELLYQGVRTQPADVNTPIALMNRAAVSGDRASGDRRRIIWLLFDELSFDQTFAHRFHGVTMPAFDAFKSKSLVFSNLEAVGSSTQLVIPSFFLGRSVMQVRSNLDGQPKILLEGSDQWQPFDAKATIFSDAQQLGWTTGVVGWFNPYCRILATTLDRCFWRMGDGELTGPVATKSVLQNAVSPLQNLTWWLRGEPSFIQRAHAADLAAILPQAKALISDENIRFVFIHLPVPHQPGIYDRASQTLRETGSYVDNLALSDRVLRDLMHSISATSSAAETTVVLCSDHSWRIPLWQAMPVWTNEDEVVSHNHSDMRPVLMIHAPGQQAERDVTTPFNEIRIHEILENLLHGQPALPEVYDTVLDTGMHEQVADPFSARQ